MVKLHGFCFLSVVCILHVPAIPSLDPRPSRVQLSERIISDECGKYSSPNRRCVSETKGRVEGQAGIYFRFVPETVKGIGCGSLVPRLFFEQKIWSGNKTKVAVHLFPQLSC